MLLRRQHRRRRGRRGHLYLEGLARHEPRGDLHLHQA